MNTGTIFGSTVAIALDGTLNIAPTNNANNTFTYNNTISGVNVINLARQSGAYGAWRDQWRDVDAHADEPHHGHGHGNGEHRHLAPIHEQQHGRQFSDDQCEHHQACGTNSYSASRRFPASGTQDFPKVFSAASTLTNNVAANNVVVLLGDSASVQSGTALAAQLVQNGNSADVI